MNELTIRKEKNISIIDFNLLEDWESFEIIIDKLKSFFHANVIEEIDGPESRIRFMRIKNAEFILINNPYGNYLKATAIDGMEALKLIYNDWSIYNKL